ncbi:MAG: c-type cytochrome [Rhodospirillales bacterium]|nr:c-type cytochrome [Rhodospirillales bacterium]
MRSTSPAARGRSRTAGLAACLASGLLALGLLLVLPAAGAGSDDAGRGKALFGQCKRCHQVGGGAAHRIGPHLNDVFGRTAGSLADYRYSQAMREAGAGGLIWAGATLDAFLSDPHTFVPHTRMSFDGMEGADDRAALLAWLRGFSGDHSDPSPAEPTATPEEYGLDPHILAIQGDREYGAYLAGECTTCHRTDGADEGIPSITGWPLDDFVIALQAYKHGKRVHPVMQMVTGRLSDEEIAALAAHFHRAEDDP